MGSDRRRAVKLIAKNLGWPKDRANTTLKKADAQRMPLSRLLTDQGVNADDALALACLISQLPPTPLHWIDAVRRMDGSKYDPVLLWQMQVVPFADEDDLLRVAFWSPDDARNAALFAGRKVRPYLSLENEITAALLALVGPPPQSDTISLSKNQMDAVKEFTTTGELTLTAESALPSAVRSSVWATNPGEALRRMAQAAQVPVVDAVMANGKTMLKGNRVGDARAINEAGTAAEDPLFDSAGALFENDFEEDSLSEKDTELMTPRHLDEMGLQAPDPVEEISISGFGEDSDESTDLIPGRGKKKKQ